MMSPLRIEIYNPELSRWIQVGEVKPGDPSGSISDNKPDGTRDIYLFECAPDNSKSTIYRSGLGLDTEVEQGRLRVVMPDPSRLFHLQNVIEIFKDLEYTLNCPTQVIL
jgi:hypothetical protein